MQKFGLVGLALALAAASVPAQAQQFINVLTGGTSGVYYPLGVALSNIYAKAIPDAKSSAQATKASVENLSLLQAGRGEIAFTLGDTLSQAWRGDTEVGFRRSSTSCATLPRSIPITSRSSPPPMPASNRSPI